MEQDSEGRVIRTTTHYSGLRKIIGNRMMNSLKQAPQAMISTKMDMSQLASFKDSMARAGRKVTYTDLLIRVAGMALQRNPAVNAAIVDGKLHQYASINIGVATGTDQGLYVPVIREVQEKPLLDISAELKEIVGNLRRGKIDPAYFTGGTFTISNMGMYDIETATPIINSPEAAILCVGMAKRQVVALENDEISVRPMAAFSLTLDHSAMDGIPGAKFLASISEILADPTAYLNEYGNEIGGI